MEEQDLDGKHLKRCWLRPPMHYGSELAYTARKKKSPPNLYSASCILLFSGALSNLHHCMLGLAENESGAWERFQLACHIQAGFLNRNFSKFLGLSVLLIYAWNGLPVSMSPMQIQGIENLLLLIVCWNCTSPSYIFIVKNNLLPGEFLYSFWKSLAINMNL